MKISDTIRPMALSFESSFYLCNLHGRHKTNSKVFKEYDADQMEKNK